MTMQVDPKELLRFFRNEEQRIGKSVAGAAFQEAHRIMGTSKPEVPVDTGNLRATGTVLPPEIGRGVVNVAFGYGGTASASGEDVNYAILVHEDRDAKHAVGKAKYLEDPVKAAVAGFAARIAATISRF